MSLLVSKYISISLSKKNLKNGGFKFLFFYYEFVCWKNISSSTITPQHLALSFYSHTTKLNYFIIL